MEDHLIKQITEQFLTDISKKPIPKYDKALIIQHYMTQNKITSQRTLAKKFNIPKSTLSDILLPLKLTRKDYEELEKNGFSKTEIYTHLRNNTPLEKKTTFDEIVIKFTKKVRSNIWTLNNSKQTINLLLNLQNELNRLISHIERKSH